MFHVKHWRWVPCGGHAYGAGGAAGGAWHLQDGVHFWAECLAVWKLMAYNAAHGRGQSQDHRGYRSCG